MSPSSPHPKWWQLYLTFPLLVVLFVLDSRLRITTRGHEFVQIGIVLLIYGLILFWIKANRSALSREDRKQSIKIYRVLEIPPYESLEWANGRRSILDLTDSEVQGLLGDGRDMSYTDPEVFSNKEIHRN
jgi:hypothetical protein